LKIRKKKKKKKRRVAKPPTLAGLGWSMGWFGHPMAENKNKKLFDWFWPLGCSATPMGQNLSIFFFSAMGWLNHPSVTPLAKMGVAQPTIFF
jgi:hypothetical protein